MTLNQIRLNTSFDSPLSKAMTKAVVVAISRAAFEGSVFDPKTETVDFSTKSTLTEGGGMIDTEIVVEIDARSEKYTKREYNARFKCARDTVVEVVGGELCQEYSDVLDAFILHIFSSLEHAGELVQRPACTKTLKKG